MAKKIVKQELPQDEEWGNIELPGLSDEELFSKNWNIVANNQRTWKDPKVAERRRNGIRKTKQEQAEFSKKELLEIYNDSWGPDRRNGWIAKTLKKYQKRGLLKDRLNHLMNNGFNTVSEKTHSKNLAQWEKQYGFGVWHIYTPGCDLLKEYDKVFDNIVPPSAVWHIRFGMKDPTPSKIREYLLKYTKTIWMDGNRVANGRYLNIRNKVFPFLTDKKSRQIVIDDREKMRSWLMEKLNRKSLSVMYMHQILHRDSIKQVGALAGYKIVKV